jgi:hypothetical protein
MTYGDVPGDESQNEPGWTGNQPPSGGYPPPPGYGQAPGYGQGYGQPPGYGPGYTPYGSGPGFGAPAGPPPPNYLGWAIASTVLCCIPAGIVAIVYAAQVNGKWTSGDFQGAARASRLARNWFITSIIVGIVAAIAVVAIRAGAGSSTSS